MGIRIPSLDRIDSAGTQPRNERINFQARDNAKLIQQRTQQVNQLVETGAELYQDFEDSKIKQLSYEAEQEYTNWNNEQLNKLKSIQGDPTEAYTEYDKAAQEKFDSIISQHPDASDRVKRHLQSNLNKTTEMQRAYALKQRNGQVEKYKHNLYESQLKLKSDTMSDSASFIQEGDPSSFFPFDQNIKETKDIITNRALEQGLAEKLPEDAKKFDHVTRDEEGNIVKYKINDIAKQRMAVELSKGVSESIESLIASGYNEKAKMLFERYEGLVDTRTKAKLNKKFDEADVKSDAYKKLAEIRNLPEDQQIAAIEQETNLEVRTELLKIKDADDRRIDNLRQRQQDANYERLSNQVFEKMNSNNPYFGIADLENDPTYKKTWDNLSAKQKKAVTQMIEAPKKTNPDAQVKIQGLIFGQDPNYDLETITPQKFNEEFLVGLSDSDRKRYTRMYENLRQQSSGEQRAMHKRAGELLKDQLILNGFVEENDYGRLDQRDKKKLIEANNALIDHMSSQYGTWSDKQLFDYVREYSAKVKKREIFNPQRKNVFRPSTTSATPTQNETRRNTNDDVMLNAREMRNYALKFRQQNGYFPSPSDPKFKQYIQNNR